MSIAVPRKEGNLHIPNVTLLLHLLDEPGLSGSIRPELLHRDANQLMRRVTEDLSKSVARTEEPECIRLAEELCIMGILDERAIPGDSEMRVL